jgi:hypothetical protein
VGSARSGPAVPTYSILDLAPRGRPLGLSLRRLASSNAWPERLVLMERPDAIVTQVAIIDDRPTFLVRAVAQKATIGTEEVVVPLALPHVLGRRLVGSAGRVRIARHGGRRNGRGRQSRQTNNCRKEDAHFGPLPYWGRVGAPI